MDLNVQAYGRQVAVLGQVARPGKYALGEARPKADRRLALAGGITRGQRGAEPGNASSTSRRFARRSSANIELHLAAIAGARADVYVRAVSAPAPIGWSQA